MSFFGHFLFWLVILALVFALLERLRPWRPQAVLRKRVGQDLFYLFLNGHLVGIAVGLFTAQLIYWADKAAGPSGWSSLISVGVVARWPLWAQFLVVFFFIDFLQWCIHNLLHRVPWLWEFHKTHHSIETMDWMGHMRFHWAEGLIYRTLLFLPLTLLDIAPEVLFAAGVFTLAMGFFNHSNIDLDIGRLGYLFNNPRMHLWHHTHPDCGPLLCNFGLNLSLWDWLFGTAYLPEGRFPERIGLSEKDGFPENLSDQLLYPLRRRRS